jgi:RNA polymerase sigma factor (sigma-70 family)
MPDEDNILTIEPAVLPEISPGTVRVKIRVTAHNSVLLVRRKSLGLSQHDMVVRANLIPKRKSSGVQRRYSNYPRYADIEMLRVWPTDDERKKICDVLGLREEDAFPKELYLATGLPAIKKEIEMEASLYANSINDWIELQERLNDPSIAIEKIELTQAITEVLGTLEEREADVLKLYFGLEERDEHQLEEVAHQFGISKERVRQIKGKALDKLRHKTRSVKLLPFYTEGEIDESKSGTD